jgi:hypothetical protein
VQELATGILLLNLIIDSPIADYCLLRSSGVIPYERRVEPAPALVLIIESKATFGNKELEQQISAD